MKAKDFKSFIVTGRYYQSKRRFSNSYTNYTQALMVNLWNGSVWGILKDGKRKLIKRVIN